MPLGSRLCDKKRDESLGSRLCDTNRRLLHDNENRNDRVGSRSKVEALKAIFKQLAEVINMNETVHVKWHMIAVALIPLFVT